MLLLTRFQIRRKLRPIVVSYALRQALRIYSSDYLAYFLLQLLLGDLHRNQRDQDLQSHLNPAT